MRLSNFLTIFLIFAACVKAPAATVRTPNFIVSASTKELAQKCAEAAEHYRKTLAVEWLGEEMPTWYRPCTVTINAGQMGAGGATSFAFDQGEVFGWRMSVQGTPQRILDSVIPHEVTHTILASHFRRPLPRWADEGAATLIEHESERQRQVLVMKQQWDERYPLRELLAIKEYPQNMERVLTLYSQGYLLADFLVEKGGKPKYLAFLEDAHHHGWDQAITTHYGYRGVAGLEVAWCAWVPGCWGPRPRPQYPQPQQPALPPFVPETPPPAPPVFDDGPVLAELKRLNEKIQSLEIQQAEWNRSVIRIVENNTKEITTIKTQTYDDSELKSRVAALENKPTPPGYDDSALRAELEAMRKKIAELEARQPEPVTIYVRDAATGDDLAKPATVLPGSSVTVPIKRFSRE